MWIELIYGNRYVCSSVMFEARTPKEVDDEFGDYLLGCETKDGAPYFREVREPTDANKNVVRRPPQRVATAKKKAASKKKSSSKKKTVSTRADRQQSQQDNQTQTTDESGGQQESDEDGFEL